MFFKFFIILFGNIINGFFWYQILSRTLQFFSGQPILNSNKRVRVSSFQTMSIFLYNFLRNIIASIVSQSSLTIENYQTGQNDQFLMEILYTYNSVFLKQTFE